MKALTIPHHKLFKAASLRPDAPFWAIGDVHGRYDLLAPLLDELLQTDTPVVLLGDYINKGPQSAQVLTLIKAATQTGRVTALRGNHEDLLLRFIARPRIETETQVRFGGVATLDSFGVTGLSDDLTLKQRSAIRDRLLDRMGDLADWLGTLSYTWRSGNVTAVHAGADPALAITDQPETGFLWGHPQFTTTTRQDGRWIVHGHHRVAKPTIKQGRIAIDTQAYDTGNLTAVRISAGKVEMLS